MHTEEPITITTTIQASIEKVWDYLNSPEHISHWAFAADDWEAKGVHNDLQVGGTFKTIMSAKDNSASFDFVGTYTNVKQHELIEYDMDDGRHVKTELKESPEGVTITQTFDPENENPREMQRDGWQAILDNFKKYTETN